MGFYPHSKLPNNNDIDSIPFVAYGMIGITTLVLAYATLMDVDKDDVISTAESATSLLPPILDPTSPEGTNNFEEAIPLAQAEPVGNVPMAPVAPIIPTAPMDEVEKIKEEEEDEQNKVMGGKNKNIKKYTRRRRPKH